jgi:hypothetical protein
LIPFLACPQRATAEGSAGRHQRSPIPQRDRAPQHVQSRLSPRTATPETPGQPKHDRRLPLTSLPPPHEPKTALTRRPKCKPKETGALLSPPKRPRAAPASRPNSRHEKSRPRCRRPLEPCST